MALTEKDLGQIKEAVKETMLESLVSEPIKKVLKEMILEATEPMKMEIKKEIEELAIMTKNGFDNVDARFKGNSKEHEDMALRLDNVVYRFELMELKKRVEVLEKKEAVRV